jgi:hypothetical protein
MSVKRQMRGYRDDDSGEGSLPPETCTPYMRFVIDYSLAQLPRKRSASFARHIKDCPSCNDFLRAYTRAIQITGALECRDIPPALKQKITSFFSRSKK